MKSDFMAENKAEKSELAKREEEVLAFWEENDIFKKSEEKDAPKGEFVFYDGPPFATGLPHYGHILAGTIKDAIPRYRTMRGYRVRRRWGWDCHGLPLENEIEKELGLKTKRDIEELGVEEFNEAARAAVLRYADDWKKIVPRLGRWVDMEHDYKTMDASYTETVWWIFKELYEKKLIYKDFKSMHLCPRCGTTLSNFEVNLGYQDITDIAVTVKLPLEEEENTYLLVWTTTPWTLPGNMAAAVNKDETYVLADVNGERLVVAKERLDTLGENPTVVKEFSGSKLVGKRYTPPFDYFRDAKLDSKERAWRIYHAPYVSMDEGTGAVHIAPAFGEDDMLLAKEHNIPLVHHVTKEGVFADAVRDFADMPVKPKSTKEEPEKHLSADIEIIKNLAERGLLFKKEKITHSYPLCWRCDTPLLNYATDSWFVRVTDIRDKLLSENKRIHWVPKEVGERRFHNWLERTRDWAISRSRYWGAPLPVWQNEKNKEYIVMGSIEELKKHTRRSGNRYVLIRHGEAVLNTKGILNADRTVSDPLTERGKSQVRDAARLFPARVDLVIHSPLERTRETAKIIADELGLPKSAVKEDGRLREIGFGTFEGKTLDEYHRFFTSGYERMVKAPDGGEHWQDMKRRVSELLYELENEYSDTNIIIVSHNGPLQMLQAGAAGLDLEACGACVDDNHFDVDMGEVRELDFVPLPHNNDYELDLHRPYIDRVSVLDRHGNKLVRVSEVFDCWYESGSMPYAEHHYPFENTDIFEPKGGWFSEPKGYPADFIAESIDQTRGWFYSLLVLGVALFGKTPYRNVITNGLVLAEDGRKMSKRLKNYPDPIDVANRHGADSIRYYMLSSSIIRGEDLNFSEAGVAEISRKLIMRLANVHSFYELYRTDSDTGAELPEGSGHVLDRWILARLANTKKVVTEAMDAYLLDRATRPLLDFVDDLSTWYIRRSRERFKGSGTDSASARTTTRHVLIELSKLMAPFTPFYAETLYHKVKTNDMPESVHLDAWPSTRELDDNERTLVERMERVRALASLALEERSQKNIRVRQPLRKLAMKDESLREEHELLELLKDEVNVKGVVFDPIIEGEVMLDTTMTDELRDEGMLRELVRHVQDMRKRAGLEPKDAAMLTVDAPTPESRAFIEKHKAVLADATGLSGIEFAPVSEKHVAIDSFEFGFSLRRAQ